MSTAAPAPSEPPLAGVALWRHPAFASTLLVLGAVGLAVVSFGEGASDALFRIEQAAAGLLPRAWIEDAAWFALPVLGVLAGLLSCLSPCILPLVPLNLAMIGAGEATTREAAVLSARFVLGAAIALSLLGLVAELGGFLLIEQRGPVLIGAGLLLVAMAAVFLDWLPMPFAGRAPGAAGRLGPVAAGAAFSLVTTPCASPLVAGLLAASAAQAVPGLSVASMLGFSIGYTALVFVAGVAGGGVVARLRGRSFTGLRAGSAALMLCAGIGFLTTGIAWF